MISITICIATCRRPHSLKRLLEHLSKLKFKKNLDLKIKIAVVDNDSKGSASDAVNEWAEKWPLVYEVEPKRGIPMVRNRLVSLSQDSDFIAFIDDDEVPEPCWLDELLETQKKYNADVVSGPVLAAFEFDPPEWVIKGHFYDRKRYKTGDVIKYPRTGNALIQREKMNSIEGPFDERLALCGGSDSFLFLKMQKLGALFVWSDEAVVHEYVPKTRANEKWLIQRSFRYGNVTTFFDRHFSSSSLWIFPRLCKALGRIILGSLFFPLALILGKIFIVRSLCFISRGLGMLMKMFGKSYQEYRKLHGH